MEALHELHAREVDKSRQSAREVFANGVPDDLLQTLRPAGLSKKAEIMFVKAARNPEVMKQLPDIDTALTNMVKQAILLTLTLQNEMPKVLRARPKRTPQK
jgi:hypothetical protein